MNTQTNGTAEPYLERAVPAEVEIPLLRGIYWSLQREFWENRSLYLAPIGVAALYLLAFSFAAATHLPEKMSAAAALEPAQQHAKIAGPYDLLGGLAMLILMVVGVFYCVEALQRERRDRSILFWKSLPVSDLSTVLTKASIPLVVLPVLVFAITFRGEHRLARPWPRRLGILGGGLAVPVRVSAALPLDHRACLVGGPHLRMALFGVCLGAALCTSLGVPAPRGDRHSREAVVQHDLLHELSRATLHGDAWDGRGNRAGRDAHAPDDARHAAPVPGHARPVDRLCSNRALPRPGGEAASLSRPELR